MVKLRLLSDEQQFTILRQRPQTVVDDQFQLVDLIADGVELGFDSVVIGYSLLMLISYLICPFASLYQRLHTLLDGTGALGYLLDDLLVAYIGI